MIEISGLTVELGGRTILDEVNLQVDHGEVVYLLGRNGAGKSTLLRALSGAVTPAAGQVLLDGRPIREIPRPAAALGVHLGGDTPLSGQSGRRYLRWLATAGGIDPARVDRVLRQVGLSQVARRRVTGYSLGMRQRLGIAAALLGRAPNLVFDEPLNGLDIDGIRWFRGLLGELSAAGAGIVIASHQLAEASRTADRVVVLEGGRKVADTAVADFVDGHCR